MRQFIDLCSSLDSTGEYTTHYMSKVVFGPVLGIRIRVRMFIVRGADPAPHQNGTDPQHCKKQVAPLKILLKGGSPAIEKSPGPHRDRVKDENRQLHSKEDARNTAQLNIDEIK